MSIQSVKPTGNLQLDLSRCILPPSSLKALFLLQRPYLEDSILGLNKAASSCTWLTAPNGLVLHSNGTTQEDRVTFPLANDANFPNWLVMARFRPTANAASVVGPAFAIGSAGTSFFGVGNDTSGSVGTVYRTTNGAAIGAKSAGSSNNWYTVAATGITTNTLAWINGAPATTQTVAVTGGSAAMTEVDFGSGHNSSTVRFFTGDLEWGAVLYFPNGAPTSDAFYQALYNADWPYCMLVPAIRPRRTQQFVQGSSSSISGVLSSTLGTLTSINTGTVIVNGAVSSTLGTLSSSVLGTLIINSVVSNTLNNLSVSATGTVIVNGVLNSTLDSIIFSGSGTTGNPPISNSIDSLTVLF